MCGEHEVTRASMNEEQGSSPHVRGALDTDGLTVAGMGIIPACAGSTQHERRERSRNGDHPRMCGEHFFTATWDGIKAGSSPHVRGARVRPQRGRSERGIIPACAGSTHPEPRPRGAHRDHPRMCGEHQTPYSQSMLKSGSSPHVRGALSTPEFEFPSRGIIPACAGSTSAASSTASAARDHPRMCGEHTGHWLFSSSSSGSSPHVRGARAGAARRLARQGIIPACAGSTVGCSVGA